MKTHQLDGVKFLWSHVGKYVLIFFTYRLEQRYFSRRACSWEEERGCVLAHPMGWGKTMQAIVLIDTFIRKFATQTRVPCSPSCFFVSSFKQPIAVLVITEAILLDTWGKFARELVLFVCTAYARSG